MTLNKNIKKFILIEKCYKRRNDENDENSDSNSGNCYDTSNKDMNNPFKSAREQLQIDNNKTNNSNNSNKKSLGTTKYA